MVGSGYGISKSSSGINYITNQTVINNITNDSNWTDGQYTGSLAGLSQGDKYLDLINGLAYEFDGNNLVRYMINNSI